MDKGEFIKLSARLKKLVVLHAVVLRTKNHVSILEQGDMVEVAESGSGLILFKKGRMYTPLNITRISKVFFKELGGANAHPATNIFKTGV